MPRCDCGGSQCSCVVIAGGGIEVTGAGTVTNPYIVSGGGDLTSRLQVADSSTVDMSATGSGTLDDPLTISADAELSMDDLTDVTAPSPTTGDTLSWDGSQWVTGPPPVAPAGAVNVGGGLAGDGSAANPVRAAVSGVWGVAPLDIYGDDSTDGLVVYIDSNGQLRAEPRIATDVAWDDITGKPSAYPTNWDAVSGKPTSWPVVSSTTALVARSGWAVVDQECYRAGNVATVGFRIQRTGSTAINSPSNGNIGNVGVATLAAAFRPYYSGNLSSTSTGPATVGYCTKEGTLAISATAANDDINPGDTITFAGTWVCRGG